MAECQHEWQVRPGGIKENCSKCGAARKVDPDRCDHDYIQTPGGVKARCSKCGAAKVNLEVQDMVSGQAADTPGN